MISRLERSIYLALGSTQGLIFSFIFGLIFSQNLYGGTAMAADPLFRFHLFIEPQSLDPHLQKNSSNGYLLNNLFRNLYWWDDQKGLQPDLAEKCQRTSKKKIKCELKKNIFWSDGSPITARDFIDSYLRLLDPKTKAPRADLLFSIEGATEFYQGQAKKDKVGFRIINSSSFEIRLKDFSTDFEFNLASSITAPIKNPSASAFPNIDQYKNIITSGPYKISNWQRRQWIQLENNPYYHIKKSRPLVKISIIEDDHVALKLYEKDELDLLRRLPTTYISKWKSSSEFHWIPVIRFDYIGFGPLLKTQKEWRQNLSESIDFQELQKIYQAEGLPPGCPGIPRSWVNQPPCLDYKIKSKSPLSPSVINKENINFWYSTQGGDDHRRTAEWLQSQWAEHLGLNLEIRSFENKIFLEKIKTQPPALFRKGLAPDRPTCLAVLETFTPGNLENIIQMQDPDFLIIIKNLSKATDDKTQKNLCQQGFDYLIKNYFLIPTGTIHFAVLSKPRFTGWKLNGMNQLDLSGLEITPDPQPSQGK